MIYSVPDILGFGGEGFFSLSDAQHGVGEKLVRALFAVAKHLQV